MNDFELIFLTLVIMGIAGLIAFIKDSNKPKVKTYVYFRRRRPNFYGLCGYTYDVEWCWKHDEWGQNWVEEEGFERFYETTYSIKQFFFDSKGNLTGFVAE